MSFIFIHLGGSSDVHKWHPHIDKLCTMLLGRTDYSIYLSFSNSHAGMAHRIKKYVGENYGDTPRLVLSTPKRGFSVQVEIAKRAACVLGPETGIMVALSHSDVRKVLLVSHSAPSNFDDWVNTTFLTGHVPCTPCHRLHSTFAFCNKDAATGAAACMAAISAKEIFDEVIGAATRFWNPQRSAPPPWPSEKDSIHQPEQEFLVVAPAEDAKRMAANLGKPCIQLEENWDKDETVKKLRRLQREATD